MKNLLLVLLIVFRHRGGAAEEGRSIEGRDLLNASICVAKHMSILTKNRSHYERVGALRIVTEE